MTNKGFYRKNWLILLLSAVLAFGSAASGFCQKKTAKPAAAAKPQPAKQEITGEVQEVAPDKSYLVINGAKVMTTKEFIDDNIIMVGDTLKLTVEKKGDKMTALSSEFMCSIDVGPAEPEGSGQSNKN